MNKLIRLFLTGTLLFTLPVTAFAAAETPAAGETSTEKEQGTIHPPASRQDSGNSSENTDISDSASDESSSAGVSWSDANTASSPAAGDGDYTVCIDPGHQGSWVDMSAQEPMAPGSSQTKNKATTGTSGNFSGVPEYEVNLQVSLVLKKELVNRGYKVVMTREDNDKAISNKERADFAAEQGADITVRIHANSDNSSSASGALTMSPTTSNQYLDQDIIQKSQTLSSCIIEHYCAATGLGNKGVISSDNMTGTNWSTIPVTILEMGFMSNQNDDLYITDTSHHELMAQAIADGIDEYFSTIAPEQTGEGEHLSKLTDSLEKTYLDDRKKANETWAVAAMALNTKDYSTVNADQSIKSAHVIKAFIMGAIYENLVYKDSGDTPSADYESEILPMLTKMITENDNDAANRLVNKMGNGDFAVGASLVNNFCQEHGYTSTQIGQKFTSKGAKKKNLTSASDCCRLLSDIYEGSLISQTVSQNMLDLLKQRPDSTLSIVSDCDTPYVLCVLYDNVSDDKKAQQTVKNISDTVNKFMTANSKK